MLLQGPIQVVGPSSLWFLTGDLKGRRLSLKVCVMSVFPSLAPITPQQLLNLPYLLPGPPEGRNLGWALPEPESPSMSFSLCHHLAQTPLSPRETWATWRIGNRWVKWWVALLLELLGKEVSLEPFHFPPNQWGNISSSLQLLCLTEGSWGRVVETQSKESGLQWNILETLQTRMGVERWAGESYTTGEGW